MRGKNILRPGQAFPAHSFWQACREKTAAQDSFRFKRFFVSERGHNCPNSPPPGAGPTLKSGTRFPETLLPPLAPTVPIHTQTDF